MFGPKPVRALSLVALASLASCAGPGFQAETIYQERKLDELRLHTSVPDATQELRGSESRRGGVRLAMGGPDYSARGYMQVFGEELEATTTGGDADFDMAGIGVGIVGRQVFGPEFRRMRLILPYRAGVDYLSGNARGNATPTSTFDELEALVYEAEVGVGATYRGFDLVLGLAISSFDGKARILGPSGSHQDGLRGTNTGAWVSAAYQPRQLPLRLEVRAGFGDLEETRITAGLSY